MKGIISKCGYVLGGSEGQTLIEYVNILVLVAVVVLLILTTIGGTTNSFYSTVNNTYPGR